MGAKLEGIGQVRDILPYLVTDPITTTFSVSAASTTVNPISPPKQLPFDNGPDRGGRVFILLHSLFVSTAPATLEATIHRFLATLSYQDIYGNSFVIAKLSSDLLAIETFNISNPMLIAYPFFNERPNTIGDIKLVVESITLTAAASVAVSVAINVGFYSDYESLRA